MRNKEKWWMNNPLDTHGGRVIYLTCGVLLCVGFLLFAFMQYINQKYTVFAMVQIDSAQIEIIRQSPLVKDIKYSNGEAFIEFEVNHYAQAVNYINSIPHGDSMVWDGK